MAYSAGGFHHGRQDRAPGETRWVDNDRGGQGGAPAEAPSHGLEDFSQHEGGAPGGGSPTTTGGSPHGPYGPGEGDGGGSSFMPNGEDGLMSLAEFVQGQSGGGGDNPNQGGPISDGTSGGDAGDEPGGFPGDGSTEVASNDPGPGGFGLPGGGGAGGRFGGGIGGGGGNPGGNPTGGGPIGPVPSPGAGDGFGGGFGFGGVGAGLGGDDGCPGAICGAPPVSGGSSPVEPVSHFEPTGPGGPPGEGPGQSPAGAGEVNPPGAAVPEPSVWAMMILGFGALGSALRAQRRATRPALA